MKWIKIQLEISFLQQVDVGFSIALEAYSLPDLFSVAVAARKAKITEKRPRTIGKERILVYRHVRTGDCRK
jgi:hypothetical protein